MAEKTARVLEVGANSTTWAGFLTAAFITIKETFGETVDWLNTNYMAIIAICTIISTSVSWYYSRKRARLAEEHHRRDGD